MPVVQRGNELKLQPTGTAPAWPMEMKLLGFFRAPACHVAPLGVWGCGEGRPRPRRTLLAGAAGRA
jgi:hypothetical protein